MTDAHERELLAGSLRQVFEQGGGGGNGSIDKGLEELGWRSALAAWGADALALLFLEQGRTNANSTAIDDVFSIALGLDSEARSAIVGPAYGGCAPAGILSDGTLTVSGLATSRLLDAATATLVTDYGGGSRLVTVPTRLLAATPVAGISPSAGLFTVEAAAVDQSDVTLGDVVDWAKVVGAARLGLSFELIGAGQGMLELARGHALGREQFGRPIASFQAVRHRLADTLLGLEAARTAAAAAAEPWGAYGILDLVPDHAAFAKALAGQGVRTAARHCQQVMAGMGFTAEHRFHHYFRRALLLEEVLGSARKLTCELGEKAIRTKQVPFDLRL